MSDLADYRTQSRAAAKEKARRMTSTDPHKRVDSSSWTPLEPAHMEAKTGLRPISQRQFKSGGTVTGEAAHHHAGRRARKSGGRANDNAYLNRDVREANEERPGVKHVGGFKSGGRAAKADGGSFVPPNRFNFSPTAAGEMAHAGGLKTGGRAKHSDVKEDKALIRAEVKPAALRGHPAGCKCAKCSGGRVGRARGGEADEGYFSGAGRTAPENRIIGALKEHGYDHSYQNGVLHGHMPWYNSETGERGHTLEPIGNNVGKLRDFLGYKGGGTVKRASGGQVAPGESERGVGLPTGGRRPRADGGGNWIASATKNKGALHRALDVPEGEKIPAKKLAKAEHSSNPTMRRRANLAETLGHMREGRKHGGKAGKGKMNVNIVIAPQGGQGAGGGQQPPPIAAAPPPRPPMPIPTPPPQGMPPGGMPMGVGIPMPMGGVPAPGQMPPPQPRKRGGGVTNVSTGSGGGLARLEKIKDYGLEQRK